MEPELAKSTFCRRCSEYFAITASALADAPPPPSAAAPLNRPRPGAPPAPAREQAPEPAAAAPGAGAARSSGGFKQKLEEMLGSKPRQRTARCFECNSAHEVSSSATSSTCKACGAYIDLQDYKINASFSRNIKTRGSVYLGSKGDLSSSKIICSQATIHGKMRGNLQCDGLVTIRTQGKINGSLETGDMVVEKGTDVVCTRPVKASRMEIYGQISAPQVLSDSAITIYKSGSLDADVTATGFTVEKGGIYQGKLTITPKQAAPAAAGAETVAQPNRAPVSPPLMGGEQKPALG